MLLTWGEPKRLPYERGIYRSWGAFFDFGDVLELPTPLELPSGDWSISVWLILPIPYVTDRPHTLVQSVTGRGAHVAIDETGSRLGCFDEERGLFIDSGVDLSRERKGWHNIVVTCDNSIEMKVTFYIRGK